MFKKNTINIIEIIFITAMLVGGFIVACFFGKGDDFCLFMWLLIITERLKDISETQTKMNKHLENIEMLNRIDIPKGGDTDERCAIVHDVE